MNKMKKRAGAVALALTGVFLGAAGLYTNGAPTVGAPTVNGTAAVYPSTVVSEVGSAMLLPLDTQLPSGQAPQTVAATAFQVSALFAESVANTATSTAAAATLNTRGGLITTESLSTAPGSTYIFTLTNSLMTATSTPQVAMYSGTNTQGNIALTSVTSTAGQSVFVFTNTGTLAWNGTMRIVFHI
jgi:hypothetical protein